ncbi:hypothetical protein V8F33_010506 [Rhypophila sp. PSN 637]
MLRYARNKPNMQRNMQRNMPRQADPETDYTPGFGSFDFFPYPSVNHKHLKFRAPAVVHVTCPDDMPWKNCYWGRDRVFTRKPTNKRTTQAKKYKTVKAKAARKLDLTPPILFSLPSEVLRAIFQPLVDNLRIRPPGVYPDHLPIPDKMGINFLVSTTECGQHSVVMVDPRFSPERCHSCESIKAHPCKTPQAKCTCRRRYEEYQALVALSQTCPRITQMLGEMVWNNACVTFAAPEALLLFAKQRPAAMARVRGITLQIDPYALHNNILPPIDMHRPILHGTVKLTESKPGETSPLAVMLDYLAQSRGTTTITTTANSSPKLPFTFIHVILRAGYWLLEPPARPTFWKGISSAWLWQSQVFTQSNFRWNSLSNHSHRTLERLVRGWAGRFQALPVQDGGFKLFVLGQEELEENLLFSQQTTTLWMPKTIFPESEKDSDGKSYWAERHAYLRERNESTKWLAERKERDARLAEMMSATRMREQEKLEERIRAMKEARLRRDQKQEQEEEE